MSSFGSVVLRSLAPPPCEGMVKGFGACVCVCECSCFNQLHAYLQTSSDSRKMVKDLTRGSGNKKNAIWKHE